MTIYRGIKKDIDQSGKQERSKRIDNSLTENSKLASSGIAGSPLDEPVPNFISCGSDNVISGHNNTWIVLGRDRVSDRASGYGGLGDTQAGAIDIVVGRMGDAPVAGLFVNPDFFRDSARIYISQKTNVDENFKIGNESYRAGLSDGMSAVALKADELRFISRNEIKLVTGTDKLNSKGADISGFTSGIDLIANNNVDALQPMVKGDNLVECIKEIVVSLDEVRGIVSTFLSTQMSFNQAVSEHYHYSPFFGQQSSPSLNLAFKGVETAMKQTTDSMIGIMKSSFNSRAFITKYLTPINKDDGSNTTSYINSKYNRVN